MMMVVRMMWPQPHDHAVMMVVMMMMMMSNLHRNLGNLIG